MSLLNIFNIFPAAEEEGGEGSGVPCPQGGGDSPHESCPPLVKCLAFNSKSYFSRRIANTFANKAFQ